MIGFSNICFPTSHKKHKLEIMFNQKTIYTMIAQIQIAHVIDLN